MNNSEQLDAETIGRWMSEHDRFGRLLGMKLEAVEPGYSRVSMTVTGDMLNSVGITHGGATFSLADFAFAVASNSHGQVAVALNAQINYPAASREGDTLVAEAREQSCSRSTAIYQIEVRRGDNTLVALFTGTVFRRKDTLQEWMKP